MSTVQYSPFTAIFENKASGSLACGSPGSGKTYFLLNVASNCVLMNQRVFIIDPKDDMSVLGSIYKDIEIIDINDIKPGSLNPFKVVEDINASFLLSLISIMYGELSDAQMVAITPIINDFVINFRRNKVTPSFGDVADYLYANDSPHAQAVGTRLNSHRDTKYGPMVFESSEENLVMSLESKVISFHGMDLAMTPVKGTESLILTDIQKFNSSIVYLVCVMLKQILTKGKYPTLFIVDEAHIAQKSQAFKDIINEFLVLGRSLNVATLLSSQSPSHFDRGISQFLSSKFCFRSGLDQASLFLDMFMSSTSENKADRNSIINRIIDFPTGRCFFIDSENRSGIFSVTSMFGDNVTSNPLMKKKKGD